MLYWDNAETVLGNTIRNAIAGRWPQIAVRPARKIRIKDRIDATIRLMGSGRFKITEDCESLSKAFEEAVWNDKKARRRKAGRWYKRHRQPGRFRVYDRARYQVSPGGLVWDFLRTSGGGCKACLNEQI